MTELPEPQDFGDYGKWPGRAVLDPDGHRLGEVREIFLDDATERPEWVLVELEDGARFVPLVDAQVEDDSIRVAQASDRVEAAPSLDVQTELSQDEERRLYTHYGLSYSEDSSDSLLPELDDSPGGTSETLAATSPSDGDGERPRPEAAGEGRTKLRRYVAAPASSSDTADSPSPGAADAPPPGAGTEAPPVLPAEGQTSEPEDTGPMVPPRAEPVAPTPPPPPDPQPPEPHPAATGGGLRSKVPPPALAGILAAVLALLIILLRRRG